MNAEAKESLNIEDIKLKEKEKTSSSQETKETETNTTINNTDNIDNTNKEIKPKNTFLSIIKKFLKDFLKYYSMRVVFSFFQMYIMKSKSSPIIKLIFSFANLRTALFVSTLPVFYKLMLNVFGEGKYGVYFSGFFAGLIGINIEEKTSLVNFLILSLLARVLHAMIIKFNERLKIDLEGKKMEYIFFTTISTIILFVSFLYPQFKGISQTIDNYAQFGREEQYEIGHLRHITKYN